MAEMKALIAIPKVTDKGTSVQYQVEELVRCGDCKKRETMYCPFYWHYKGTKHDDWFCGDGQRRTDDA